MRPRNVGAKHRFKRLESPYAVWTGDFWDEVLEEIESDSKYKEIAPVFRRDGWYYDRAMDVLWFEQNGRAWERKDEMFAHSLEMENVRRLSPRERAAIRTLVRLRLCPPELRKLLDRNDYLNELGSLRFSARRMSDAFRDAYLAVERSL